MRLALAVIRRRSDLALSQLEVWAAGGPSNTTLTTIENGKATQLTPSTAKKLDRGLGWDSGTALSIWRGPSLTQVRGGGVAAHVLFWRGDRSLVEINDDIFRDRLRESEDVLGVVRALQELLERRPEVIEDVASVEFVGAAMTDADRDQRILLAAHEARSLSADADTPDVSDLRAAAKEEGIEGAGEDSI